MCYVVFFEMVSQRPGAFSIYLEPWHPDIFDFLDLRKNHGSEEKVPQYLGYNMLTAVE